MSIVALHENDRFGPSRLRLLLDRLGHVDDPRELWRAEERSVCALREVDWLDGNRRFPRRAASATRQRAQTAHAGRVHPEALTSLLVAQPGGDCRQNTDPISSESGVDMPASLRPTGWSIILQAKRTRPIDSDRSDHALYRIRIDPFCHLGIRIQIEPRSALGASQKEGKYKRDEDARKTRDC